MKLTDRLPPRQLAFDVLLAGALLTLGVIGTLEIGDEASAVYSRDADAIHLILVIAMTAPLALRRVFPIPVFSVALAAWVADRGLDYPETPASIGVAVAFYTIGSILDQRQSLRIGGISAAVVVGWTAIGAALLESVGWTSVITTTIATLTPLLVGREMHERRRRVEDLRIRAEHAELEREEQARRAVLAERARIARELHDVVAHQMTVMVLQAEGAKRIATDADPRLLAALDTIRASGHSALGDMRRTVALLRMPDTESATEPLPRLDDLSRLIDQVRGTGVDVFVDVRGDRRSLPEGAELSAYRIIQESLTNTVRHGGPGVRASVVIDFRDDVLDVVVSDDGRGSSADPPTNDGGHGLVGMRERVAILGGDFSAGPMPGGGFRVKASIPVHQ